MKYRILVTIVLFFIITLPVIAGIIDLYNLDVYAEEMILDMNTNKSKLDKISSNDNKEKTNENETEQEQMQSQVKSKKIKVKRKNKLKINDEVRTFNPINGEIKKIPLEDYIVSVVAAEMPVSFHENALATQAIAARSFAVAKMIANKDSKYDVSLDYNSDQAFVSVDALKKRWGKEFDVKYGKVKNAVYSTKCLVATYDDEVINAYFHSTSSGMTQNSGEVWKEDLPYLQPVISNEVMSPKMKTNIELSFEQIQNKFNNDKVDNINDNNTKVLEKNEGGYVQKCIVLGKEYKGYEVRKILGLNSNAFDMQIDKENKKIIFTVFGFGHGVGMSQYGANYMAQEGKNYEEIIKYYYTGVEIKSYKDL